MTKASQGNQGDTPWWRRILQPWWTKTIAGMVVLAALVGGANDGWGIWDRITQTSTGHEGVDPSGNGATAAPAPTNDPGGWGPGRTMYTGNIPSTIPLLNSVADHPLYGDMRNFVNVRSLSKGTYNGDIVRADIGDEVVVSVVVHNNAADNLPPEQTTIHGLRMRYTVGRDTTDDPIRVVIEADNASAVWDSASVVTPVRTSLQFISGSITFKTNHASDHPLRVPDAKFAQGGSVPLGQSKLDGELPVGYDKNGVYQGAGIAEFRLVVVASTE